ncbi:hypothetical protein MMC28_010354 [Mycoblastus sanguinarius]|nr:hypothetical protein [Mycoblastus sanguinarius]
MAMAWHCIEPTHHTNIFQPPALRAPQMSPPQPACLIMPFIPHTPESLLPRSDSKNPATTCKGITSSGRPCRRPLSASPQSSPTPTRRSKNGVVAVLQPTDEEHEGAAAFFCWQHKDQATLLTDNVKDGRRADIVHLEQRTSIDTLVHRLGVVDIHDTGTPTRSHQKRHPTKQARKETLPRNWQEVEGPLLAVPGRGSQKWEEKSHGTKTHRRKAAESNLSLLCCVRADQDYTPAPRVRRHTQMSENLSAGRANIPPSLQSSRKPSSYQAHNVLQDRDSGLGSPSRLARPNIDSSDKGRPSIRRDASSHTQDLLSLMPRTLSPQITSLLLAELAKPVSSHDEEGFIYIFWLTDAAETTPDPQAASLLLSDSAVSTPNDRRKSDILQAHPSSPFLPTNNNDLKKSRILLKIGRASNVQRRMNEWTRQCGYSLSLIRYYPHVPTSPMRRSLSNPPASPSSPSNPQKVPHAHRVERLIHLELADQRVKRICDSCGKEHREWFEVESSREGLKKVDDVVKRWVIWAQRMGG